MLYGSVDSEAGEVVTFMKLIAYVDPGLGLLAWQAIVAAFVGTFFYIRKTRDWLIGLARRLFRRETKKQPEQIIGKISASRE